MTHRSSAAARRRKLAAAGSRHVPRASRRGGVARHVRHGATRGGGSPRSSPAAVAAAHRTGDAFVALLLEGALVLEPAAAQLCIARVRVRGDPAAGGTGDDARVGLGGGSARRHGAARAGAVRRRRTTPTAPALEAGAAEDGRGRDARGRARRIARFVLKCLALCAPAYARACVPG